MYELLEEELNSELMVAKLRSDFKFSDGYATFSLGALVEGNAKNKEIFFALALHRCEI